MNQNENISTMSTPTAAEPENASPDAGIVTPNDKMNPKKPEKISPEKMSEMCRKGKMKLAAPFRASGKDVEELSYDFGKLTGWDFANAIDGAASERSSAFRLTQRQAFMLFAAAAEKCNEGVDAEDIQRRMGIDDAIKATQIAALFFNSTSQAGNLRMLS